MPRHYYFVEKLNIVEKQLCKLNSAYGKVSHALKEFEDLRNHILYHSPKFHSQIFLILEK